ncbi:MAG TPA: MFS transporter [Puia sp.]|nr:MFS transporter [Puia sp.]
MTGVQLGLKANWRQFSLLVVINAFVGGMVGLERSILPAIAQDYFHILAKTAVLSFIVVFGLSKAITNYFSGVLANKMGRKALLTLGWGFGLPVPFILMFAQNWDWIVTANILLGINQGLAWSSTVVMKIDLVGEKERGFAVGLNEFAGYVAVAVVAFLTGWVASLYSLRPFPFYIGVVLSVLGFLFSWLLVKDTSRHMATEIQTSSNPKLDNFFWQTTWKNKNLGSVTQAGLVNNLNDGMAWGLFPILFASRGFSLEEIGILTAIYPAVWGIGQLFTGRMADHFCKKDLLFLGMLLQGIVLILMVFAITMTHFIVLGILLGWGTAMVYPTFLATVAENTNPSDRAKSLGVFRFWRDSGYAFGAIMTGLVADHLGLSAAILLTGLLTIFSATVILIRMNCGNIKSIRIGNWLKYKNEPKKARKTDLI